MVAAHVLKQSRANVFVFKNSSRKIESAEEGLVWGLATDASDYAHHALDVTLKLMGPKARLRVPQKTEKIR